MIEVDRYERDHGFVVRIRLHDEVEKNRLTSVFHLMAGGERPLDLARQEGFRCADIDTFLLGVVGKMHLETVSIRNKEVNWTKTAEGWLEASDLVNGLTSASHQILGDGDATVEVELGAG
jgi:hypothetical protein